MLFLLFTKLSHWTIMGAVHVVVGSLWSYKHTFRNLSTQRKYQPSICLTYIYEYVGQGTQASMGGTSPNMENKICMQNLQSFICEIFFQTYCQCFTSLLIAFKYNLYNTRIRYLYYVPFKAHGKTFIEH